MIQQKQQCGVGEEQAQGRGDYRHRELAAVGDGGGGRRGRTDAHRVTCFRCNWMEHDSHLYGALEDTSTYIQSTRVRQPICICIIN